jgi:hypothetical protein
VDSSRDVSDTEDSDSEPSPHFRSRLAKRIQTANSRKSQLSKAVVVSKSSSAAASPNGSSHTPAADAMGSINGSGVEKESDGDGDVEDSDLDDWANEFEKELA